MVLVANARMYSVAPAAAAAWKTLLRWVLTRAGLGWELFDHAAPAPISELWDRDDLGAAMMCGLPYSERRPRPTLIAAPIPSPSRYGGQAIYFSDIVVRADAPHRTIEDTFGGTVGFTVADSMSGFVAFRRFLLPFRRHERPGLYRRVIGGLVTPRRVVEAVAAGEIDVGPVDSYALDLLRRHEPALVARVRPIAATEPTPIPGFVATADLDPPTLAALRSAFLAAGDTAELGAERDALLLRGFAFPDRSAYDVFSRYREEADRFAGVW